MCTATLYYNRKKKLVSSGYKREYLYYIPVRFVRDTYLSACR